jgi:tetratricopeptide (TPR) repeat protein
MQTKLSRICEAIIEAGWLAALIATPLFFNTSSSRVFEPDKLHLLRSIALVMAVAWIVQLLDTGLSGWIRERGGGFWSAIQRTPLVLPTLALVAAYILSTALSLVPRISFLGSYVRMQGTYTFISYVLIFFMVLTHLRTRAQINRIFYAIILSSLPISIYGIIQHYGLDPLPWGGDVRDRVAANMGNAIFVAAYLIIALFLTLERLVDSIASLLNEEKGTTADALRAGAYFFVLAVQLIAIYFTQSRGPWGGLAAGAYVFVMLGLLLATRWATGRAALPKALAWLTRNVRAVWLGLIGLTLAGLIILGVMNVPQGPLKAVCGQRYVGRLCTLFSLTEGTNAVRALIWEGVVDMMLKPHAPLQGPNGTRDTWNVIRPLVGYGPESMWVAYNNFYPPDLGHYEARNASPDRSHNETFDAIVRTGLIGFAIQLWLYISIFYYALRWLGLMEGRKQRNMFLGFLAAGAFLGVVIPVIADGSLRLAGIGLPAGLIFGLIVYVTVDLLLTPTGGRDTSEEGAAAKSVTEGGGRRQLLLLTLFAAIVAHFFEIHLGIAIASTLTTFWVLAAVLVAVGMGWANPTEEVSDTARASVQSGAARRAEAPVVAATATPTGKRKAGAQASISAAQRGAPGSTKRPAERQPAPTPRPPAVPVAARTGTRSPILTFLPYASISALITLILTWDYLINQTGAQSAFDILWNAFTTRSNPATSQFVQSPMLLMLLGFTWLVGGLLAVSENSHLLPTRRGTAWAANAGIYAATVIGVWLIFGLLHANRLTMAGLSGIAALRHITEHIVFFDTCFFLLTFILATVIWFGETRPRPARFSEGTPVVPLLGGAGAALLALLVIVNINVQTVQADTFYKQGQAYENAGEWEGAAILHNEAANLEPTEDYYYLFLGRALLQLAGSLPAGTATLPTNIANLSPDELLALVNRGLGSRNREDMLRASYAALLAAQKLNPLNTDHSANLARHNRTWAFTEALGPNDPPTNALLRELVATNAKGVDLKRLNQAANYYREAVALSPQNVGLLNELATTQFILGDTNGALASLNRAQEIDSIYSPTYILRGDMFATLGDKASALAAYRKGAELTPGDPGVLSAVGVYSAQTGDNAGALDAFRRLADLQLAGLAGDASQRSQLHLTYRNIALVARDAGRLPEALDAARTALSYASDAERPSVEALIADLQNPKK